MIKLGAARHDTPAALSWEYKLAEVSCSINVHFVYQSEAVPKLAARSGF